MSKKLNSIIENHKRAELAVTSAEQGLDVLRAKHAALSERLGDTAEALEYASGKKLKGLKTLL